MATTIRTTLHAYHFDTSKPDERAAWHALQKRLLETHPACMHSHGGGDTHWLHNLDGATVELDTRNVFDDQWNTAPIPGDTVATGRRVFDWALEFEPNGQKDVMRGHYLDQTDEMRDVRARTLACGYCGAQYSTEDAAGAVFCARCLGSEYLEETDLYMLRLRPAGERFNKPRAKLTDAERAELLPRYVDAQTVGRAHRDAARIEKERKQAETDYVRELREAEEAKTHAAQHRMGRLWVADNVPGLIGNMIYYKHTRRFCFGWRQPIGPAVLSVLLDKISEFPAPYDIKTDDGRTLSDGCATAQAGAA